VRAGFERATELPEPFDNANLLLANDADRPQHDGDHDDGDQQPNDGAD
jgi:hypothetical protein